MEDYLLFLDEGNVSVQNPYFCLAGIIIRRDEYEKNLVPKINLIKEKHFGKTSIIFHYTEMKKNKNEFNVLIDGPKRAAFWADYIQALRNVNFTTIGTYIHMETFKIAFRPEKNKEYTVALIQLMNNYIQFLRTNKAKGSVIIESRQWNENRVVQEAFYNILHNGTNFLTSEECMKYLSTVGFIIKKENCIGLQIADLVPDSFLRKVLGKKDYYNIGSVIHNKLFNIGGNYKDVLGLYRIM